MPVNGNLSNDHADTDNQQPPKNNIAQASNPSGNNCDDEIPTGTPREERLARRLKNIDVLSPKSSVDAADGEEDIIPRENSFPPLHSPAPNMTMASAMALSSDPSSFQDPPQKFRVNDASAATVIKPSTKPKTSNSQTQIRANTNLPSRVTLLVGGTRFVVNPQVFIKFPTTMLGR